MANTKKFLALCEKYGVNPKNIPVEVLTLEQAFKLRKLDPNKLPVVSGIAKEHKKRIVADYKLTVIAEAMRGGKTVKYTDNNWKYHPVFEVEADSKVPSGFGLACSNCDYWCSNSLVGVRLCFPNRDMAIFFGKHFLQLHKDHHLYT
ncbi:MAG: hypothetical protein ACT4OJ_04310 [Bacteroidota bacterium]